MRRSTDTTQLGAASIAVDVSPQVRLRALLRRGGAAIPFLLVHGLASNARMWDGVAGALAQVGHDSVAVDLRGHGESNSINSGFDFETLTADLTSVIDAMGWDSVIAVGQSWGGNVVLELGARKPSLVAGVGLIDGGFLRLADDFQTWDEAEEALTPPTLDGVTLATMEEWMSGQDGGFPKSSIPSRLANFEVLDDGTIKNRLRLENHLAILRHLWAHDPDTVGANVTSPIEVIAVPSGDGKQKRVNEFAAATTAEVHWRDGHHDIHTQQPDAVTELLLRLAARAIT